MSANRTPTVVIADYDYGDVDIERSIVTEAGFKLVAARSKSEDEVIAVASDADAVLTQYAEIGKRAIDSFKRCKIIARYGIGVDIVDVEEATRRNIVVTNVPNDWCMNEVADHAVALLIALVRKLPQYDRATRAGVQRVLAGGGIELRDASEKFSGARGAWMRLHFVDERAASAEYQKPETPNFEAPSPARAEILSEH